MGIKKCDSRANETKREARVPRRHKSSIARRNDAHERTIWRRLRRLERRKPRRRRPSSVTMKKISSRYARGAKINLINPRLGKKGGWRREIHPRRPFHSFVSSMRDARGGDDRCDGRSFVRSIPWVCVCSTNHPAERIRITIEWEHRTDKGPAAAAFCTHRES